MNVIGKGIILKLVLACIGMLLLITPAYSANVIISGDSTDVGTIVVVSPKPGDAATTNGTALLNTLAGITTASATEPYLIKLGPGTYDLGSNSLQMKQYVSIEGSGEEATTITAALSSSIDPPDTATVQGASNAGLRFVTVKNTGTGTYTVAIRNSSASPSIIHVTVTASGGTYRYAVYNYTSSPTMMNVTATASGGVDSIGVFNYSSSSPTMTNVTATASGGTGNNFGVLNSSSSPTMTNVTATASGGANSYGVYNGMSGIVRINHSVTKGTTNSIVNAGSVTAYVVNTQMDGASQNDGGTLTCAGVYDEGYAFFASTCP